MRISAFLFVLLTIFSINADAVTLGQRRGGAAATVSSSGGATSARSPVSARSATRPGAPTTKAVAARSATTGRAAVVTRGVAAAPQNAAIGARAAIKQKVISTGTKVAGATQNVVVSDECRQKYEGCMDSFCMLDNTTGGRCICSDKNAELNDILAQIEKLDQQSYQMATFGVEKIEMGDDADEAIAKANAAAQSVLDKEDEKEANAGTRRKLDLSAWDALVDFDADDDIFDEEAGLQSIIDGKEGDALHRAAAQICTEQIPECGSDIEMLQMMYAQKVRSDCAAYENSLKQQKTASAQKLATAEQALRDAALEQLRTANKYDLGQCTVEFKKCMITTGGCGEDFSNCASVSAMDNTNITKSSKKANKMYSIKGSVTTIDIYASTYDTLEAKKTLCMGITDSCVAVKDQVWDTFLREVAPQIKSAELIAEDKARQDCIGNISACFQKACKDNIDPDDPDGSYDMCLSRPENMLNVCKIPLNACGVDTSAPEENSIWDYVLIRLAAMRDNACNQELKACLKSPDRCGEDYSQCIGLDNDTIVGMCSSDLLSACVELDKEGKLTTDPDNTNGETNLQRYLEKVAGGIMANIDNAMMQTCQEALDNAMIKVCGNTENCDGLIIDNATGSRTLNYNLCAYSPDSGMFDFTKCYPTLEQIQDQDLGRRFMQGDASQASADALQSIERIPFMGRIGGQIAWENISINPVETSSEKVGGTQVMTSVIPNKSLNYSVAEINVDSDTPMAEKSREEIESELAALEKSIQMAIQAIESDPTVHYCMTGRQVQGINNKMINRNGVNGRFPTLTANVRTIITLSALNSARTNYNKRYDELQDKMLKDYVALGERIAKINSENLLDARRQYARSACVDLSVASAFGKYFGGKSKTNSVVDGNSSADNSSDVGYRTVNEWNYRETVTSTFTWDTLVCHRCTRKQSCANPKRKWCKRWGEETENCVDIQF